MLGVTLKQSSCCILTMQDTRSRTSPGSPSAHMASMEQEAPARAFVLLRAPVGLPSCTMPYCTPMQLTLTLHLQVANFGVEAAAGRLSGS